MGVFDELPALPWRTALTGLGLQFHFALFMLKATIGQSIFTGAQNAFLSLLDCAAEGSKLVFGSLANDGLFDEPFGNHWSLAQATAP